MKFQLGCHRIRTTTSSITREQLDFLLTQAHSIHEKLLRQIRKTESRPIHWRDLIRALVTMAEHVELLVRLDITKHLSSWRAIVNSDIRVIFL